MVHRFNTSTAGWARVRATELSRARSTVTSSRCRRAWFALFEGVFELSRLEVWLAYEGNPGTTVAFGATTIAFFCLRIAHIAIGMTVARGTFYSPYLDSGQLAFTYSSLAGHSRARRGSCECRRMRRWIAGVLVVIASARANAAPTRLVVAGGDSATLIEAGATAKVAATVKLPASVQDLVWIDRDPVVLLDGGGVGRITAKGFVAIPTPRASTFVLPRPSEGSEKLDQPEWELVASTAGELWLGRCDWGFHADGRTICENWVYARLGGPTLFSRAAPASGNRGWNGWPSSIAPSPTVAITFGKRVVADAYPSEQTETMTCRAGATTTTFPTDDAFWTQHDTLRWISRDPPIFVVDALANGFAGIDIPTVFEGCTPSTRFAESTDMPPPMGPSRPAVAGYVGPAGLFVLATGQASALYRDGKQQLALPPTSFVAFERDGPLPPPSDAFALLERELAGDASMFAADAIVLTPAPVVGAPKLAKHASARIERFATAKAGDAWWLAAELQLDGKPYRTLQLFDASGHVVVASFAPIKSLAAGGAAPRMPSPTSAGPLAELAASPAKASKAANNGTTVFGTELGEHADGYHDDPPELLAKWSKLALVLDPAVREVHAARYGYAIASVTLGKSRMIALVLGTPDQAGWHLAAIHYLGL